jgi:DNA-directed RNA polymerase specialized sigma24 family protein
MAKISLAELVELSAFPNQELAKIMAGNQDTLEACTLFLLLLPYFILCWICFITADEIPDTKSLFPELLGENGTISFSKLNDAYAGSIAKRLECIVRDKAQKNLPIALRLLVYASQTDPDAALVDSFVPEFRKRLHRLGYLGMDLEDGLQTAQLHLVEELQPLRQSKERLFEALLSATCNYAMRNVYYKLVDDWKVVLALKRKPRDLIEFEEWLKFEELSPPTESGPAITLEDFVAAKQSEERILKVAAEAFPGDSRKVQIIRDLLQDPDLSSEDLARHLGCSKKTIDRDLSKLRQCQLLRAFLGGISTF